MKFATADEAKANYVVYRRGTTTTEIAVPGNVVLMRTHKLLHNHSVLMAEVDLGFLGPLKLRTLFKAEHEGDHTGPYSFGPIEPNSESFLREVAAIQASHKAAKTAGKASSSSTKAVQEQKTAQAKTRLTVTRAKGTVRRLATLERSTVTFDAEGS